MNICTNAPINFRAKYVNSVPVDKFDFDVWNYKPHKVSFLEYDYSNEKDFKSLYEAVRGWHGQHYAGCIVDNASLIVAGLLPKSKNKIYILTEQKGEFDNLNSRKIMGLAQMELNKDKPDELKFLQVRPNLIESFDIRKFKNIGKGIIDSLKSLYNKNGIFVNSSRMATGFYEKQGFERVVGTKFNYIWKKRV